MAGFELNLITGIDCILWDQFKCRDPKGLDNACQGRSVHFSPKYMFTRS
jgi:hypothetical protein